MDNFKNPYFSSSISEFWKRWHISLSTWFRDYLYISLGGKRVSIPRWYFNLFITFLVSGFWHGANWTFILWGAIHGFYLIFGIATSKIRTAVVKIIYLDRFPKVHKIVQVFITFILVCFAWIFFRANNANDAYFIITRSFLSIVRLGRLLIEAIYKINFSSLLDFIRPLSAPLYIDGKHPNLGLTELFILVSIFILIDFIDYKSNLIDLIKKQNLLVRWSLYIIAVLTILNLSPITEIPFIYFQF